MHTLLCEYLCVYHELLPLAFYSIKMHLVHILLWGLAVGDVDNYHSTDIRLLKSKRQLLGSADLDDPTSVGGIRARLPPEQEYLESLQPGYLEDKKAVGVVKGGFDQIDPIFQGVAGQYKKLVEQIGTFIVSLESNKESTDKAISNFAKDWNSVLRKRNEQDPETNDAVFAYYNSFVSRMYNLLDTLSKAVARTLSSAGKEMYSRNFEWMHEENKTQVSEAKQVATANSGFARTLRMKTLPTLVSTKYEANANVARLGNAAIESFNNLKEQMVPAIANEGLKYLDVGGEAVLAGAQKLVVSFSSQVQKQLVRMRSELQRIFTKDSTLTTRNLTAVDTMRTVGAKQIEANRKAAQSNLLVVINQGLLQLENFKQSVLDSAGDLTDMLSSGDSMLTAIEKQAQLGTDQLDTQLSAQVAALFNPSLAASGATSGVNRLQAKIGSLFTTSQSGDLVGSVKTQLATALSDAEEASGNAASQFAAVSADQQSRLEVDGKVGVQNANLQSQQNLKSGQIADFSTDLKTTIDSARAENEDAETGIVSKFQKSITSKQSVVSAMSDLRGKIAARQTELSQQARLAAGDILGMLEGSRSTISSQEASADAMEKRLSQISDSTLPQLDAQNEARIKLAFSQLNELRRLGSTNGDLLETNSAGLIAGLIQKAMASGSFGNLFDGAKNLTSVNSGLSEVRNAASDYQAKSNQFETDMNKQMNSIADAFKAVDDDSNGTNSTAIGFVVAHSQSALADAGRGLIRAIYNSSGNSNGLAKYVATNPKFNVPKYLGFLLNDTDFKNSLSLVKNQLLELGNKRELTKSGVDKYVQYLADMKAEIVNKYFFGLAEDDKLRKTLEFRNATELEVDEMKAEMNATILNEFRFINESISNKTSNFYKQFQTASIVADSLVQGFADYVEKMISVEKMTEAQRAAMQAQVIQAIQAGVDAMPRNVTQADQIDKVNELVRMAMNASDTSAAGMKRRADANEALLAIVGTDAAGKLKDRYSKLAGNAEALASAIDVSKAELVTDRVGSLTASKMGIDGINAGSQLFANQAGDVLETQKKNAKLIEAKVDELLSGSSFLTNISSSEFGEILISIQSSDSLHASQMSGYQESSGQQVATLGGVVEDFAQLVTVAINATTDYLNQLSANYTDLIVRTDAVTKDPVDKVKEDLARIEATAENVQSALNQQLLSITPIQDGLKERMEALLSQQDAFASSTHQQLSNLVANVHQMDGDIARSREAGMTKLRTAITSILESFRNTALDLQSKQVDDVQASSLLQSGEADIKKDMVARLRQVRRYLDHRR